MPRLSPRGRSRGHSRGLSLIEVLVAILVVSLGILVMVVMQIKAAGYAKSNEIRTLGTLLVSDLADRIRANPEGLLAGGYTLTTPYPGADAMSEPEALAMCLQANQTCSPEELAQQDMAEWQRAVFHALPGGAAHVTPVTNQNVVDIWLIWHDRSSTSAPDACPESLLDDDVDDGTSPPRCMSFRVVI